MPIAFIVGISLFLCIGIFSLQSISFAPPVFSASDGRSGEGARHAGSPSQAGNTEGGSLSTGYHSLAKSSIAKGAYADGISYLRLAFIYASKPGEKESLLLERGELYLAMKNYQEAAMTFQIFNTHFPDSPLLPMSQKGLGDAQLQLGRADDALKSYERSGRSSQSLLGRIRALNIQGNAREAASLLESLTAQEREELRGSEAFIYESAEAMRSQGKYRDARSLLDTLKDGADKSRKEYLLGMIALSEDDQKKAAGHLENSLSTSDRELRRKAMLTLADLEAKRGRRAEAKSFYRELIRTYPYGRDYRSALMILAEMEKNDGRNQEALALLRESVFAEPADVRARDMAAEMLLAVGESDRSAFLKNWGIIGRKLLDPSRSEILFRIAQKLRNEGKPFLDLCGWLYRNGTTPAKQECGFMLAQVYGEIGDFSSARNYLEQSDPKDDRGLGIRAMIYAENREYDRAVALLKTIRNPSQSDIRLMSQLVPEVKDAGALVSRLEKGLGKAGGDAQLCMRLADHLFRLGRRKDALEYYRLAQALQLKNDKIPPGDRDWVSYRISGMVSDDAALAYLDAASGKDPLLGRVIDARKKELALNKRVGAVLQ